MILTLIKTLTADDDSSLSFVDGTSSVVFDSTYDEYMFVCTDISAETQGDAFAFQVNATDDAGGGYDTSLITSSVFKSYHQEDDVGTPNITYDTGSDLAQAASFQEITHQLSGDADMSANGILHIFNPSSTTYVKHFYSRFSNNHKEDPGDNHAIDWYTAGYINDTTAIDEIQFKMSSGNFDGVIQLYGIA